MEIRLNRRQVMIGTAAVASAAAFPLPAKALSIPYETPPPIDVYNEILKRFTKNYMADYYYYNHPAHGKLYEYYPKEDAALKIVKDLTKRGLFKLSNVMTSPNMKIDYPDYSSTITANPRSYKCWYGFNLIEELKEIVGADPEYTLHCLITDELEAEIKREIVRATSVAGEEIEYYPYTPVQLVRAIDPNTFQPMIGFKTQYDVATPGGTIDHLG